MFRILCVFDEESGVDALDPFGDIEICDESSTIAIRITYLDSWLDCLLRIVDRIKVGAKLTVTTPEEPEPILISVGPDEKIDMRYQNQLVRAESRQVSEAALCEACRSFLGRIWRLDAATRNPTIRAIKEASQRLAEWPPGAGADPSI